jgi:hypothetical protein
VAQYRKRPLVITAMQWTGENIHELITELTTTLEKPLRYPYMLNGELIVPTLEGTLRAQKGDYIIRGVDDELYPCKKEIFQKTYELVK